MPRSRLAVVVCTTSLAFLTAIWLWPWLAPAHYHPLTNAAQWAVFAAPMDGSAWFARIDHVLHAVIAFSATVTVAWLIAATGRVRARWWSLAIVAVVACADEAVQTRMAGRDGDWFDLLSGAMGLLAAIPAVALIGRDPAQPGRRWRVSAILTPPLLVSLALFASALTADRTVLIETDFGAADATSINKRVSGPMPARWRENSQWADVWAKTRTMSSDGTAFLRVEVDRRDTGRLQWYHSLPPHDPDRAEEDDAVHLRFRARSLTRTHVSLEWRIQRKPYTRLWERRVPLGRTWMDFDERFPRPRTDVPCGLFISIADVGVVDLASMRVVEVSSRE